MPGANIDNLPTFREGDPVSAAQFNKLVDALRQQVLMPGSFRTGSFSVQRPMNNGGGSVSSLTKFALVIDGADADGGVGTCVLLSDDSMAPLDADLLPLITDIGDPDYDAGKVSDAKLDFKCVQVYAGCRAGARIWLSSKDPIAAGNSFEDHPTWGACVDASDYIYVLPGAAPGKVLYIVEGATGPDGVQLAGDDC